MTRKIAVWLLFVLMSFVVAAPASADDQVNYVSQPDVVTVFLNGVVFVQDALFVPVGVDVHVVLPDGIFQDTLIVKQEQAHVPFYSISRTSGHPVLVLPPSGDTDAMRHVTLEYLATGMAWKPLYTMGFFAGGDENVQMTFNAEVQNDAFSLDEAVLILAAGRVDTTQQVDTISTVTANQFIAGYANEGQPTTSVAAAPVTIQYIYRMSAVTSEPGEMFYTQLMIPADLPARRLLLWNASTDRQVTIIYKVINESAVPFSEGTVRSYQDGMFIGSDFIEFTPIGGEGSVTVGGLQDVRVFRSETTQYEDQLTSNADTRHFVELTLENFSENELTIEVVDTYPAEATEFNFSDDHEPHRDFGNLLRWEVTLAPGEEVSIRYGFRSTY